MIRKDDIERLARKVGGETHGHDRKPPQGTVAAILYALREACERLIVARLRHLVAGTWTPEVAAVWGEHWRIALRSRNEACVASERVDLGQWSWLRDGDPDDDGEPATVDEIAREYAVRCGVSVEELRTKLEAHERECERE